MGSGKFCSLSWRDRACESGKSLAWRSRIWISRPAHSRTRNLERQGNHAKDEEREANSILSSPRSFGCSLRIWREELREECFKPLAGNDTPDITCGARLKQILKSLGLQPVGLHAFPHDRGSMLQANGVPGDLLPKASITLEPENHVRIHALQ
jgi:hypothetical protein